MGRAEQVRSSQIKSRAAGSFQPNNPSIISAPPVPFRSAPSSPTHPMGKHGAAEGVDTDLVARFWVGSPEPPETELSPPPAPAALAPRSVLTLTLFSSLRDASLSNGCGEEDQSCKNMRRVGLIRLQQHADAATKLCNHGPSVNLTQKNFGMMVCVLSRITPGD